MEYSEETQSQINTSSSFNRNGKYAIKMPSILSALFLYSGFDVVGLTKAKCTHILNWDR